MCTEKAYVVVVGGVNVDIGGKSFRPLIPRDSNPGRTTVSLGGVGRNIAHNLALLGVKVHFLTAFGTDPYALQIEASCAELGIDISRARKVQGASTSTYVFLQDLDGDMAAAVSDMTICEEITPAYLQEHLGLMNGAGAVVLDANLPEESIGFLAGHVTAPLFADPVSVTKARKLAPYLDRLYALKPNRLEAEALVQAAPQPGEDETSALPAPQSDEAAADALLARGVKRVFLSLGERGVCAAGAGQTLQLPCLRANVKNTTGAGDAFMAALVLAHLEGADLETSARLALGAAAIAVEGEQTINPCMGREILRARCHL